MKMEKFFRLMPDLNEYEKQFLIDLDKNLNEYLHLMPLIHLILYNKFKEYQDKCQKENNQKLREAIGDLCNIMSLDKKPPKEDMKKYLQRVKDAIFPNGIQENHHQGEKLFYKKFLE